MQYVVSAVFIFILLFCCGIAYSQRDPRQAQAPYIPPFWSADSASPVWNPPAKPSPAAELLEFRTAWKEFMLSAGRFHDRYNAMLSQQEEAKEVDRAFADLKHRYETLRKSPAWPTYGAKRIK